MKSSHKHLVVAGMLACMGFAAAAQGTQPAPSAAPGARPVPEQRDHRGMHRPGPAKMAEFHARRTAELKAKLKITPAQEGAFSTFTEATKPSANRPPRPDHAEFEKLTTPQRIERMQAMKAQRDAEMAKRLDATKTFYAALTPEQQKTFDSIPMHGPGGHHGKGPHGGPRGPEGRPAPAAPKG